MNLLHGVIGASLGAKLGSIIGTAAVAALAHLAVSVRSYADHRLPDRLRGLADIGLRALLLQEGTALKSLHNPRVQNRVEQFIREHAPKGAPVGLIEAAAKAAIHALATAGEAPQWRAVPTAPAQLGVEVKTAETPTTSS